MKKMILSAMMIMAMVCASTTVNAQSDNKPKAKKECCDKKAEKKDCCKKNAEKKADCYDNEEGREGWLQSRLQEVHRVQGYLQRDWLQGLQAQGTVQEELQEIIDCRNKKRQRVCQHWHILIVFIYSVLPPC